MAKDTITFELGGRVDIRRLDEGIAAFRQLVSALTVGAKIDWIVDDLQPGSALITLRGEAANQEESSQIEVEKIVGRYEEIGRALERQTAVDRGPNVAQAMDVVRRLIDSVEYVRFETLDAEYTIYPNGSAPKQPVSTSAIGSVTGRVQTLSSRAGFRFNLYDSIHDKAVSCYLVAGQEELMRQAWGRTVRVSGHVSREAKTGRPMAIREILTVDILEDAPTHGYLQAKGAVPWRQGDLLPEEAIRRLRDA